MSQYRTSAPHDRKPDSNLGRYRRCLAREDEGAIFIEKLDHMPRGAQPICDRPDSTATADHLGPLPLGPLFFFPLTFILFISIPT